jgi:hypothetical protein
VGRFSTFWDAGSNRGARQVRFGVPRYTAGALRRTSRTSCAICPRWEDHLTRFGAHCVARISKLGVVPDGVVGEPSTT